MTDRDRLIKLLEDTLHEWECDVQSKTLSQIAEHLIENGVIVPPCKVGDNVYWINRVKKEIETDLVIAIHQYENGLSIATSTIGSKCTSTYGLNRFLEIMHFTKEQAEQALKEQNNG